MPNREALGKLAQQTPRLVPHQILCCAQEGKCIAEARLPSSLHSHSTRRHRSQAGTGETSCWWVPRREVQIERTGMKYESVQQAHLLVACSSPPAYKRSPGFPEKKAPHPHLPLHSLLWQGVFGPPRVLSGKAGLNAPSYRLYVESCFDLTASLASNKTAR